MSIDFNLTVTAGDVIGIEAIQGSGGVIADGVVTFKGGLYTATSNSLVTYLGQVVSSPNPPSPAR